jgi:hypothetical protein
MIMPHKIRHLLAFLLLTLLNTATLTEAHAGEMLPASPEESCTAELMFSHLGNNTYVFYNTSEVYDNYSWDFEGDIVTPSPDDLPTLYTFTEDTSTVCLYISTFDGCTDTICVDVYQDAPHDMCNLTDCVWPGDANGNQRANQYDLLNIGVGYNQTGPERPFYPNPSNPNEWVPNFGYDWGSSTGAVDFKHLDCDGDGVVNEADLIAINQNYTPESQVISIPTEGAPPVFLELEAPEIIVTEDLPPFFEVKVNLHVGNSENPISNLYGLALYLEFSEELGSNSIITADYNDQSFLAESSGLMDVKRDISTFNSGRYDYAVTRNNGLSTDGYGEVARFSFIVSSDIIEGRVEPEIPFEIDLAGIILRSAEGDTLAYSLDQSTVLTFINNQILSNSTHFTKIKDFELLPNPANNQVTILEANTGDQLIIRDTNGRIMEQQVVQSSILEVDVSMMPPGLYFVEMNGSGGRAVKKLMVL